MRKSENSEAIELESKPKKRKHRKKPKTSLDMLLEGLIDREVFTNKLSDLDEILVALNEKRRLATLQIDKEITEIQRQKNVIKRFTEVVPFGNTPTSVTVIDPRD
jgi:hypothetical protein